MSRNPDDECARCQMIRRYHEDEKRIVQTCVFQFVTPDEFEKEQREYAARQPHAAMLAVVEAARNAIRIHGDWIKAANMKAFPLPGLMRVVDAVAALDASEKEKPNG